MIKKFIIKKDFIINFFFKQPIIHNLLNILDPQHKLIENFNIISIKKIKYFELK